ncbi:hypothetical protein [Corynebacterium sp. H130]|uniref:hypothetical protein n=1 Tax=Corynebacterium sp. H130 TaxID=3133444 RepID=UPI0030952C11
MRVKVATVAWAALLIGMLLWPLVHPGALLYRDMAVLAHPALTESALGFGDLPARNAPQDGLLALVGMVADASWFARLLLVASAAFGAYGAVCVARKVESTPLATLLAVTMTVANPFIVERLLQGHWSLCIAAWLLPGIAVWSLEGRWETLLPAMWLASLTPTGAVIALVVALVAQYRHLTLLYGIVVSLPWLVPSVLSSPTALPQGASMFAARAEHLVGTAGALVGLGGIWNAAAVPASREAGFALAGVALFAILLTRIRSIPRRFAALLAIGILAPLAMALLPSLAEFAVAHLPGAALFRDSQKLVILAIAPCVFLAASLRPRALAASALVFAALQVWDAPMAVEKLAPVPEPAISLPRDRDVFLPHLTTLALIEGTPTVNPLSKAAPVVENGELRVDGVLVDAPAERFVAAHERYKQGDTEGLRELGIGAIYADGTLTTIGPAAPRSAQWWLGFALLMVWISAGLVALGAWRIPRR